VYHALRGDSADAPSDTYDTRCDNPSALTVHLERLLSDREKFILMFDDVDKQREAPPTLLPALARLGEIVSCDL